MPSRHLDGEAPRADTARMTSPRPQVRQFLLAAVAVGAAVAITVHLLGAEHRAYEEFAGHVANGRYAAASTLLARPSELVQEADGTLLAVDREGRRATVAKEKLPFLVGGSRQGAEASGLWMTALGTSKNGMLDTPPKHLHVIAQGGALHIALVE